MIRREDFYPILFKTIETYFMEVFRSEIKLSFDQTKNSDRLYVFSPPSFISRRKAPKGLSTFLYSEYNIRGNFFKFLLGKLGVFVATHSFGYMALRSIYFSPTGVFPECVFIVPNNRSIRVFNYEIMMVDCIIKDSFTNKYFINQLNFRKSHQYSFVPPLIDCGDQWFREPIMLGNALARVTSEHKYNKGIQQAIHAIGIIAKDTIQFEHAGKYVRYLIEDLLPKIDEAAKRKHIKSQAAILYIVKQLENGLKSSIFNVPVVLGHGDLQTGNIWLDKQGKIWIYDWETSGMRSVWYDAATLLLSLRRAGGIENMWKNYYCENVISSLLYNDERKDYSLEEIRQIVSIVLLEDIQFYLDDLLELPNDFGGWIFDLFARRLINLKI